MTEIGFSDFLTQVKICLLNKNEEQKDLKEEESFVNDFSATNRWMSNFKKGTFIRLRENILKTEKG